MSTSREFRELLAADAALILGVAEARDVAAALQRYWDRRDQPGVTFESELAHIARLSPDALSRIRAEVERLLGEAGGDAKAALTRHGGLDRSIHLALGQGGANLTRALSVLGIPIRAPLRTLPEERYVGYEAAGVGGMGIVYAALDTEMNRRVAFKMVRPHAERGEDEETPSHPLDATRPPKDTPASEVFEQLKARLVQEAWVTGGLEHPGIVPVYEIGQTPTGIPYYTMRYVRGERTLADALREKKGAPFEERLALLEPFLKVCDTLRYAHDKGVVHRDLKPANVALGQYGEVVLLDWGLARLEGKEDVASSAWQEQVEVMRHDAGFHTMEGGALGTAGYMAPEAALGRLAEVDQRSDVYSLGAMLFEILTGRLPFEFRSFAEYASLLLRSEPASARGVDPSVPEALSALCTRTLSREKDGRPASAAELADAVRAWQVQNAVEREVEALLRDACAALDSAERLTGDARLQQVDRAAAGLAQGETKRPGSAWGKELGQRALALREEGIRERERASARRVLRRVAVGALAAAAVAAFVVVTIVEGKRREAEEARHATNTALLREREARELADRATEAKAAALMRERATGLRLRSKERLATDPALALRLAIEGARIAPGPEMDDALRLALEADRHVARLRGMHRELKQAAFDAEGEHIFTLTSDGTLQVWELATAKLLFEVDPRVGSPVEGTALLLSTDGRSLAVAGQDRAVLLDPVTGRVTVELEQGSDVGGWCAFDASVVAAAGIWDRTTGVRTWRPETAGAVLQTCTSRDGKRCVQERGDELLVIDASEGRVTSVRAKSPDSHVAGFAWPDQVAVAVEVGSLGASNVPGSPMVVPVVLRDAATGEMLQHFEIPTSEAPELHPSLDGRHLIVSEPDRLRIWDVEAARFTRELAGARDELDARFSPDGRWVVSRCRAYEATEFDHLRVWDVQSGSLVGEVHGEFGDLDDFHHLAFARDGSYLACAWLGGRTVDVARLGSPGGVLLLSGLSGRMQFSADGSRLLIRRASDDSPQRAPSRFVLIETATGREMLSVESSSVAISARGDFLAHADGRAAVVRRVVDGQVVLRTEEHGDRVTSVAIDDAGDHILAASADGKARVYSLNGSRSPCVLERPGDVLRMPVLSHGGRRVAALVPDGAVIWDVDECRELVTLSNSRAPWLAVAFAPDERHVLAYTDANEFGNRGLEFWNLETGVREWSTIDHGGAAPSLRWAVIANPAPWGSAELIQPVSGRIVMRLETPYRGHPFKSGLPLARVAVSPDEARVALAPDSSGGGVWLWRIGQEEPDVVLLRDHTVSNISFSDDGRLLLGVPQRGPVHVWDASDGRLLARIDWPGAPEREPWSPASALFSPDGSSVLVSYPDGTSRIWPLDPLPHAEALSRRLLTAEERLRYLEGRDEQFLRKARDALQESSNDRLLRDEIVAWLSHAPLDDDIRRAALVLADEHVPDPDALLDGAWAVALAQDPQRESTERAMRWIEEAARLNPLSDSIRRTAGMLHYRSGDYESAVRILEAAGETADADAMATEAFLALAHARLGRGPAARAHLARLRALIDEAPSADAAVEGLLAEAAGLIEGKSRER